tara:strand:- start:605 stop:2857 length:2253 start_codon:yes stop_codon:yes gene_type:complete
MLKILSKIILFISFLVLASCASRSPEPLAVKTLETSVNDDIKTISNISAQNEILKNDLDIDLYKAIAIAIENNKDIKVKLFETALANQQLEDIRFDMLPSMSASAGYTGSDKYQSSTSATVSTNDDAGSKGSSFSTSRTKDVFEQDVGFAWNALDFGLSYIRAGQSADRSLIAKEIEKKSVNNIAKDVIQAYWNALSAQKLIKEYDPLIKKVNHALSDSQKIEEMLLQKPMDALLYQKELLDIKRALITQRQTLINAKIILGGLMGLMPYQEYNLVQTSNPINILDMELKNMEKHALINRTELLENRYQERISLAETRAGIRSLLPSLNLNAAYVSSSNNYLQNKQNFEYGTSIGANLINVFRAPSIKKVNEANTAIIREQRLALSMAVLSQVHLANIDFQMSMEEYETADHYLSVSRKIASQVRNAQKIARFGDLELIREDASSLVAELRKDIAFAKMQYAAAQVYTSVGVDVARRENFEGNTVLYAEKIEDLFEDLGENYKSKVIKPIQKQNPVAKDFKDNFAKFSFAKNTFKLQGNGQAQYSARLANNQPLPYWIDFLPTQRTFLIDKQNKGELYELDIIVNVKNVNTTVEDKFTLILDQEVKNEIELVKKQKIIEEKKLQAQKLKEEKERIKAEEKLAKIKTKQLELFYERVTTKNGTDLKLFSDKKINKMIVKQDKKNKKIRKKMAKQEKEKAKVSIFKKIKNKIIKKKSVSEKEASLGDLGESAFFRLDEEALTLSMLRKNQKF